MLKVLYIEDNSLNRRLVKKYLHHMGIEMLEAINGQSGLLLAAESQPRLILVDINLPDIDGFEVARQLKGGSQTRHIPKIALTANAMHGDRELCLGAGYDDYLAKPVSRQELFNVLKNYLKDLV